jgi:hypothetical protein
MTSRIVLFFLTSAALSACFLAREYKQKQFTYSDNGRLVTLPLMVPRGYLKEEKKDTAGITLQTFYYPGGAMLYTAYLQDTAFTIQPFNESLHQPQIHRLGGLVFKGQDEKNLYYREIRRGNLRFGYRLVPEAVELPFVSATNFASLQYKSTR